MPKPKTFKSSLPYRRYADQRRNAAQRGIPFELTFDEWLKIWADSGHFHERGRNAGQYVMGRIGDKGPYAIDNVIILLHEKNDSDAGIGRTYVRTIETREKLRIVNTGKKLSAETKDKIGKTLTGKKRSVEFCIKMKQQNTGRKLSEETKAKIRESNIKAYQSIELRKKIGKAISQAKDEDYQELKRQVVQTYDIR